MTDLKNIIIGHIHDYLRGTKTIHEIKADTLKIHALASITDSVNLPKELLAKINLSSLEDIKSLNLPNPSATRLGLIHMLDSYLYGKINAIELCDWADDNIFFTMENQSEDLLKEQVLIDIGTSQEEIPKCFTPSVIKRLISLLKTKRPDISESILLLLSYEEHRNSFSFLLTEYKNGQTFNLSNFLQTHFQANLDNFIFKDIFEKSSADKSENLKLLDKLFE